MSWGVGVMEKEIKFINLGCIFINLMVEVIFFSVCVSLVRVSYVLKIWKFVWCCYLMLDEGRNLMVKVEVYDI